ncbi:MAG: LCCL domain-containing protein, partial [Polyangiales bacterium]
MRNLASLALLVSLVLASACNKSSDSKKSSSSSEEADEKGSSGKKKKSGDDDDTTSKCATTFRDASKDQKGNEFSYSCPADCELAVSVWGTGWYTSDSSICAAAIHAGAIKASKGGKVTVKAKKGLKAYKGSKANGVNTTDYGSFEGSFSVNDSDDGNGTPKKGEAEKITCSDSVNGLGHKDDDDFKAVCPPGCKSGGSVWGSGPYTSDSSICRAAIHAGVITDDDGGKVTLKISAGEKSYTGSKKNGVKTEDYGS